MITTGKRQVLRFESQSEEIFDPPVIQNLGLGENLFVDDRVTLDQKKCREICSLMGLRNLATLMGIVSEELKEQLGAKL